MRFAPKSESEIASENLLQPGTYDFEIINAEDTTSKSGNEMIKLTVRLFDNEGAHRQAYDYLLESVAYKLRHCCEACGLLADYEGGHLDAEDFIGKAGKCKVSVQKDKTGQYPDRNGIADYLRQEVAPTAAAPAARARKPAMAAADVDDEIPF